MTFLIYPHHLYLGLLIFSPLFSKQSVISFLDISNNITVIVFDGRGGGALMNPVALDKSGAVLTGGATAYMTGKIAVIARVEVRQIRAIDALTLALVDIRTWHRWHPPQTVFWHTAGTAPTRRNRATHPACGFCAGGTWQADFRS